MNERSLGFTAGRTEAIFEGATVFAGEKSILESDVDMILRHARLDRQGPEVNVMLDTEMRDRFLPGVDLQLLIP